MLDVSKNDDLETIKGFLKLDYNDDDIEIKRAWVAALSYLKGAIGNGKPSFYNGENIELDEQLNLAVLMLTDHYYNARSATIESNNANGTLRKFDYGLESLLLQLKGKYLVFKEGVSNGSE